MYVERLHALQELKVCHNLLQSLPARIRNFANLKIFDVSYNCLLYLPINIFYILSHMNISKNPFLSINLHHSRIEYRAVPTLVELSANIVLKHRFVFTTFIFLLLFLFACFIVVQMFETLNKFENYKIMLII